MAFQLLPLWDMAEYIIKSRLEKLFLYRLMKDITIRVKGDVFHVTVMLQQGEAGKASYRNSKKPSGEPHCSRKAISQEGMEAV